MKVVGSEDKYQQVLKRLNQLEMSSAKAQVKNQPLLTHSNAGHNGEGTKSENSNESSQMEANYVGNRGYIIYSNTYNLRWHDHPNLRWGQNQEDAFMESQGKDPIQWLMRSNDEVTKGEEANEEGSEDEEVDDDEATKDDDAAPHCDDFKDLFMFEQPSSRGPVIRNVSDRPKLSYKNLVIKGKRKGVAEPSECP
ncbi:hypothetical protein GOBAR_DD08617 [Gossypium barbadense]|nr:hypothetical protein GOBAR_DD08617 [Gossypium barbadense]